MSTYIIEVISGQEAESSAVIGSTDLEVMVDSVSGSFSVAASALVEVATGTPGPATFKGEVVSGIQTTVQKIRTASQDVHILCLDDSTSASSSLWFGRLPAKIALLWPQHTVKYREWDSGVAQAWTAYTTIQTGSNGRTIHFHNGSVGGQSWAYPQRNRLAPMVGNIQPDLIFTSYLYNSDWSTEAQAVQWVAQMSATTESILLASPGSAIVCLGKPGKTFDESVAYRDARLRELARRKGFGYIDLRAAFDLADPNWRTNLIQGDGIHPTAGVNSIPPSGQDVILADILRRFTYVPDSQTQAQSPSTLAGGVVNLLANGSFADWFDLFPNDWTPTNATCTRDTTWRETGVDAVKIKSTAAGAASLSQSLSTMGFKGEWVTCSARVRIPAGAPNPSGNGLIQLLDGVSTVTSSSLYSPSTTETDGFGWVSATMKVDASADILTVNVIGTTTGGAGNEATFDRVILSKGILPRDEARQKVPLGGTRLVCMGDSISSPAMHGTVWTAAMCELSDQRITFAGTTALGGQLSADCVADIEATLALNPSIVTITAGANDIASSIPLSTFKSNMTKIANAMAFAGVRFVLTTITPNPSIGASQNVIGEWNLWLKAFAASRRLDILDFHALVVDPVTMGYKSGFDSGDGIHPSQAAHIAMAEYALNNLLPGVAANTDICVPLSAGSSATVNLFDPTNLVKNPMLEYGTPTPTNWTWIPASGHAGSLVSDSEFGGKAMKVEVVGGATGGLSQFISTAIPVVPGERYVVSGLGRIDASTAVPALFKGLRFEVWFDNGVNPVAQGFVAKRDAGRWRYEVTVPAGATLFNLVVLVNAIAASETFTCHFGEFCVRKLT